ncbi:hypothetical protein SCHPADRAFT_946410 [Schizopora paradoxa]|uniref:Uncharacterized protein n=1 Tax=Schizopora paradoxa TaxID=27342 RepID=A0A0H2R2P4_9AGAM|nr:hypothetical protein SCHPADRAFT_946410 [Schizopora paradoxa]
MADIEQVGLYVLLCNGFHHVFRFSRHGSPSELGMFAVNQIPTEPQFFDEWVERLRRFCQNIEIEGNYQVVEDMNETGTTWLPTSNQVDHGLFLSRAPPRVGRLSSWIYTIDLDRLIFTIDNSAHFDLFRIRSNGGAGDWIKYLALDGRGRRCFEPAPPESLLPNLKDLAYANEMVSRSVARASTRRIERIEMGVEEFKDASHLLPFQECTAQMAMGFMVSYLQEFRGALSHHPSTVGFQVQAAFLLSLLAPGFYNSTDPEISFIDNDDSTLEVKTSTSPRGTLFRFRNCLIVMTSRLDLDNRLEGHIEDVVDHVVCSGEDRCTAILWSVQHMAVLKVTNRGEKVEYSPIMPVLAAFRIDDTALLCALRMLSYHLSPTTIQSDAVIAYNRADTQTLPWDTILQIMGYMDEGTYYLMGTTCKALRYQSVAHPLIGPFRLLGFSDEARSYLRGSINNGPAVEISFTYRMLSDEALDLDPRWSYIFPKYPRVQTSFFSFERFEGELLEFFVGQRAHAWGAIMTGNAFHSIPR